AAGLMCMYAPTLVELFRNVWSTDQQGHGPIILALCIWLFYRKWPALLATENSRPSPLLGWLLMLIGVLAYVLGRSQDIIFFEVGSAIWIIAAIVLLLRGKRQLASLWFMLFFMIFMIPLPGQFVDALTQPMKIAVSIVAEQVLYWFGYPIARSGVILQIGPYQLMVADACAGLQTLFTLEALGLFYLNVVRHSSAVRNITLAILIIPISFTANVIRVMALTLITYYLGDEAGQGFLHGFAGIVLFSVALLLIISADTALRVGFGGQKTPELAHNGKQS
ncbi:MAG TPA: exosortase B, partial [Rhodocyclaceae bacterium]|nr:exosortase B [Rhodocyclaceae bacterium]